MDSPKVSVIIPTYKGAHVLPEAVQSILNQTYQNFEVIIVDDASPDHTVDLFKPPPDPRVRYLVQEKNAGARAARRVGIRACSGEIVAFLDQDDLYHPEKLQAHVDYFKRHPDAGMTYNARFSISDSIESIRNIWRPPQQLTLHDVVMGFPLSPSDIVLRREWARPEYMEGPWGNSGGEIVLLGRLILGGCKVGYVDRALNYRRFESGRIFGNLSGNCASELKCLEIIFIDPRCPADVLQESALAPVGLFLYWGSLAFSQGEVDLGKEYFLKALQLMPSLTEGTPSPLMVYLLDFSIEDESRDHTALLRNILSNLPAELRGVSREYEWAVACGHLVKGAGAIMWNRPAQGQEQIEKLKRSSLVFDDSHVERLVSFLVDFDAEYGVSKTKQVLQKWTTSFGQIIGRSGMKRLEGRYLLARAFRKYHAGRYLDALGNVLRVFLHDPAQIKMRGTLAVIWRSMKFIVKDAFREGAGVYAEGPQ